ncbi:hypothetical protein GCM10007937_47360 [Mesorhizobium albiziae]|nr:hypothetical protein GCM10007937_47360 [Mesorhizobium albiziae]
MLTPVASETRAPVRAKKSKKGAVAPTTARPLIGGRNEGVHFGLDEMVRHLDVRPFLWQSSARVVRHTEGRRIGGCDLVEERSDRG